MTDPVPEAPVRTGASQHGVSQHGVSQHSAPPQPASRGLLTGVGLAVVVTLVLGGFAAQAHAAAGEGERRLQARADALFAGRQEALNLTSVDSRDLDGDLKRVQDGATGDFAKDFAAQSVNLRKVLTDNAVESAGEIKDAAVVAMGEGNATVIVVVNSTVKNKARPAGTPRTYRMRLELIKSSSDRWQTAKLEFVG